MNESKSKNNKIPFADYLRDHVVIFDGAMGTEIYREGIFTNRSFDELNLSGSKLIRKIHHRYLEAGVDVLTTNTYGANRFSLQKYGLGEESERINREGVANALAEAAEVTDRPIYIAGSVGLFFLQEEPTLDRAAVLDSIEKQVRVLIQSGVDFIIFETLFGREAMELAAEGMKSTNGFPFALSLALGHGEITNHGDSLDMLFAPWPSNLPKPIAYGVNCGLDPQEITDAASDILKRIDLPLIVQPNAGSPKEHEGRQLYYCSPEYIATYAMRCVDMGVAAFGGCCGTTPRDMAEVVKLAKQRARTRSANAAKLPEIGIVQEKPEKPFATRSALAEKLARHQWITTVELTPPVGFDLSNIIEKSRKLKEAGIDAVNLPDGPRASARISSLIVADRILHEAGIEPVLHFCCRDRNLVAMQADMFACAACGIHNILFISGDPPKLGKYHKSTGVFDTNSVGTATLQTRLNRGIDLGGDPLVSPTEAVIGVGLDPTASDQEKEIARFREKIAAGAHFAITQPVFDPDRLFAFLDAIGDCPIPIIAGVWPLVNYRNAVFMQNEVPGVVVPDEIMRRMEDVSAGTNEQQREVGIAIAREAMNRIRDRVSGVQVSAPFGRIETPLAVLNQ